MTKILLFHYKKIIKEIKASNLNPKQIPDYLLASWEEEEASK